MNLQSYYHIIKTLIESDQFDIKAQKDQSEPTRESCIKNSHLESIHYLMAEFMRQRKDNRLKHVFTYVCKPYNAGKGKLNMDFSHYDIEQFLKEIMTLKD